MQTNPLKTINPCALLRPKGSVKTRGITAYDLLKDNPYLKVRTTQSEIQSGCRPSFDHPKILHILIDRANGYGSKKLAKMHGGNHQRIGVFTRSMGFDRIKPDAVIDRQWVGERLTDEVVAERAMEAERLSDLRSIAKYDEDRHWGASDHPAVLAWKASRRWHTNEDYRNSRLAANISGKERERRRAYGKKWKSDNKDKNRESVKRWMMNNPDKARELARKQRAKPINKIRHNIRKRLRDYMKASGSSWGGFGCTSDELRSHLESKFTKGMTWENYGTFWHVDHDRPLASFDLFDRDQRKAANHYTNLQPLKAADNLAKSDQWDGQTGFDHIIG